MGPGRKMASHSESAGWPRSVETQSAPPELDVGNDLVYLPCSESVCGLNELWEHARRRKERTLVYLAVDKDAQRVRNWTGAGGRCTPGLSGVRGFGIKEWRAMKYLGVL